ncbi:MAG: FtsQ-type POTRA domain-containing protein [Candidatus Omnitrophica bacterium]|nr:FtsQ-type POTRA domain-containing protein [Candidatus Omnitrophota bacterium]
MVKRRQIPLSVNIDALRWGLIAVIVLVFFFLAIQAISSFLYRAKTFTIDHIVIPEDLGVVNVAELEKMKGHNIFTVDLANVEEKVRSKYPRIGGIKITRRFPDEILVFGFKREPVALALMGGRTTVVSRDGVFMGSPGEDTSGFPVIKGLKASKVAAGVPVGDERLSFVYSIIDAIRKDQGLMAIGFRSVDIHDPEKIICVFGEGKSVFDIFLDQERALVELRMFSNMVGRMNLDLSAIKYIDLRFKQPVIGQKKTKK